MPLDTYANLQASILSWLARPGDPLVSPAIPDIIQLFESEARRRLKVGGAEERVSLTALSAAVALPADFGELRLATSGGVNLTYVTPMQLPNGGGPPAHYTIIGNEMRLGPSPSGGCTIEIVYQRGVPPLSDTNTANWLLDAHPDCYLFGSLVEAESFIGSDERVPLWAQRREAAFASIETADRKARWGGAPLSIRAEGVSGGNGTAAGDWTSAPPVPIPIAAIVAGDGLTGGGTEGIVTVALDTPVAVGRGGTGAATAAAALANLGGAPLASPVLTGDPQAPTPAPGDADTSIATTAFVGAALSAQALAGDVAGPTNNTSVLRLQGRPVAATAPTSLQVLQWSGTNWAPATIAAGGTLTDVTAGTGITVSGAAPSPTVALTVPVSVANGGTGATTAGAALTALGAAPLNAPVFTGDARAVTPATADNDTSIATTAYVQAQGYATSAAMTTADNLRVLKAGDTMTGNLAVGGSVTSTGSSAAVAFENRATPGSQWQWYADAGGAHLYFGANELTVDGFGNGTLAGNLAVGNNAKAQLGMLAGQTSLWAPDGGPAAQDRGLFISNTAGTGITYRHATHFFQDAAGASQFGQINGSGFVVGSPTGGAKGAGTINAVSVYGNNVLLTSDASLKRDIEPLPPCLALVDAVEPKSYRWAIPEMPERPNGEGRLTVEEMAPAGFYEATNRGFLAQDVAAVLGGADDAVDLGALVAVLWQSVRELSAKVAALEGKPA